MKSLGVFGVADGTWQKPLEVSGGGDAETSAYQRLLLEWENADIKAQKYIVTTVGKSIIQHLICCKTASSMWTKLLSLHEFKSECSIHLLQQQYYELKMSSDDTIEKFVSKVEEIAQRLKDLDEPLSNEIIISKV